MRNILLQGFTNLLFETKRNEKVTNHVKPQYAKNCTNAALHKSDRHFILVSNHTKGGQYKKYLKYNDLDIASKKMVYDTAANNGWNRCVD